MKNCAQAILFSFLLHGIVCMASVETPLTGETTDGWVVFVDLEASSAPISVSKKNDNTGKTRQDFTEEHCVFEYKSVKGGGYTPEFSCPISAKSPLAGTKYVAHPNNKSDCEKGGPFYIYICVSGCETNKRAPRKLFQGSYEGECP